ncbi:MAG TPA: tRNA pseudouridine(38-40) synthase TruA [Phycisphaerales bacterium]|nr:tRNA pseudouridine(38-40) synthase TruA [Phycisphaerales bacterium]
MAPRNVKLTIAYDGTDFHGWQIQPGYRTAQGVLTDAVKDLFGPYARICGASRTDAGVHALGQVGLIQIDSPIPTENIPRALNGKLPPDIAVTAAEDAPRGIDIIGDVTSKLYRYTIHTGAVRPVLDIRYCWYLWHPLDIDAMHAAAQHLLGRNDFRSFAASADRRESTVRTIFRCDVARTGDWVHIDVEGDGFLYNMVRNIVGTLVDLGHGRWTPDQMKDILNARDRTRAGRLAPPAGLCLMWVKY